ncbi:MAG: hypothetical protein HQL93_13525, partial [Magnetococcales bacterium]|nr:hypothetical protein [Magnetococcales bacterium]
MTLEPNLKPLRAVLVQTITRKESRDQAEQMAMELEKLAISAGLQPLSTRFFSLPRPHPGSYLGKGNLETLAEELLEQEANL